MHVPLRMVERSDEERLMPASFVVPGHDLTPHLVLLDARHVRASELPDLYTQCLAFLDAPTRWLR